jgi:hypothetical protein
MFGSHVYNISWCLALMFIPFGFLELNMKWSISEYNLSFKHNWRYRTKCGFPSFPVVDWFCLFVDVWILSFPLEDCSVFGNFVMQNTKQKTTDWAAWTS